MLHNLNLRNVAISIRFLKSLIWLSAYLKIISSAPINGSLGLRVPLYRILLTLITHKLRGAVLLVS